MPIFQQVCQVISLFVSDHNHDTSSGFRYFYLAPAFPVCSAIFWAFCFYFLNGGLCGLFDRFFHIPGDFRGIILQFSTDRFNQIINLNVHCTPAFLWRYNSIMSLSGWKYVRKISYLIYRYSASRWPE